MTPPRIFDRDEAKRLLRLGLTCVEVGRRLGVSDTAIARACRGAELEPETQVFVQELTDREGDLLWSVSLRGTAIASTYDRRQLTAFLDALNRPVRWLVPA